MKVSVFDDRLFIRYLKILGIQRQKPDFEYLKNIVRAQMSKIPFENISKLFYKKRIDLEQLIDFELYLEGIEKYRFGGTCYSINFYLNKLLEWLGYNIKLCGADMKNPDVHIVYILNIKSRDFLIDTGYAAPFLEPIPLDLSNDHIINMGIDQYILKRQNNDRPFQLELYRNGKLIHGYKVNPKAREIDEFRQVIEDSFKESSTFMNAILLTRFNLKNFIKIHNMSIIESYGKDSKSHSIDSIEQLSLVINKYFNIPKSIVLESIDKLQMQVDGWN
jgi:arylamine N-acetyltransferase